MALAINALSASARHDLYSILKSGFYSRNPISSYGYEYTPRPMENLVSVSI